MLVGSVMTMMSPLSNRENSTLLVPEFKNDPAPVGTVSAWWARAMMSGTFFEITGSMSVLDPVPTAARAVPGSRHSASATATAAMILVRISFDTSDVRNTCASGVTGDTTRRYVTVPGRRSISSLPARRTAVTYRDRRRLTWASGDMAIRGLRDRIVRQSADRFLTGPPPVSEPFAAASEYTPPSEAARGSAHVGPASGTLVACTEPELGRSVIPPLTDGRMPALHS